MTRGFSASDRKELIKEVRSSKRAGEPIKKAFARFAMKSGRKPDSVRNYYYSYLASLDCYPEGITKNEIVVFTQKETRRLVAGVLHLCSMGKSVRGAIAEMTGDKTQRLRFQNKYRNLLKQKSPLIFEEMERCKRSKKYYDPFKKRIVEIERELPVRTYYQTTDFGSGKVLGYFDENENVASKKLSGRGE